MFGIASMLYLIPSESHAQNGGIELFSGETLFEGGTRLSLSSVYQEKKSVYRGSHRIHTGDHRRKEELFLVAGVDYGIHRDVTLTALMPFVEKIIHRHRGRGSQNQYASGYGDLLLTAKYRPLRVLWRQSAFNIAVLLGLELPTGDTTKRERGRSLDPDEQPGSGSFDPLAAVLTTLSINRFRMDTQLRYKWNTKGHRGFDRSDVFIGQIGFKYRFLHKKYPGPSASATVRLRYRYESNARQSGRSVANEGADIYSVVFALGAHPLPELDVGVAADVPFYQRYRGTQFGLDTRLLLNFGYRF